MLLLALFTMTSTFAKGGRDYRYDQDKITQRKSLDDAYARFGKIYKPYNASQSNLNPEVAQALEQLFTLADMAVIEKVLLLEFIGEVADGDVARDKPYDDYYVQIIEAMKELKIGDKRLIKIREDLIAGINYHREVLDAWLDAARRNQVQRVKNEYGRWVHPGTAKGDALFYALYHQYIVTELSDEYPENLQALSRHLCVLVF